MNNKKNLISVIVPVYNVERYLSKCIDSLINQTYKNIEVLLIDDGSTDNSGNICDEYQKKDNRISVYHKKNGGLSSARNFGISKAKGEFLCFIDSDDYIDNNMIGLLYYGCVNNQVDISWCDKIIEYDKRVGYKKTIYTKPYLMTTEEAFANILLNDPSVCDKMFNRKLFKDVKFPEGKLFEDIITVNHLIYQCDKIYHVGEACYHYLQRENSIVHKTFDLKKLDYIKNAGLLKAYVYDNFPNLKEVADSYYILTISTVICDMYKYRKKFHKEYINLINEMKENRRLILNNKYIPSYKKVMCILISFGFINLVNVLKKIRNLVKYR